MNDPREEFVLQFWIGVVLVIIVVWTILRMT